MLQHVRPMAFFDETAIPEKLYYVSAFSTLESEGVKALLDLLRREIRGHGADLLVIDGFLAIEEFTSSMRDMKRFIQEVQAYAVMANCTVLLLTNGADRPGRPEHTMVDGLIELDDQMFGVRTERSLRVKKFRGSGFLPGRHYYGIGEEGLVVHPRIEARYATPSFADVYTGERRSTGNDRFDEMLHGGLPAATTTALIGPTGSGKTTFGLQFLSACSAEQPGLAFGFYETPPRLRGKAASLGIDLAGLEADGHVELLWQAQGENVLDELGHRLLDAVPRRGVKRLLLDGLGGMIQSAVHPDRITRFFAVLANELRAARRHDRVYAGDGGDLRIPSGHARRRHLVARREPDHVPARRRAVAGPAHGIDPEAARQRFRPVDPRVPDHQPRDRPRRSPRRRRRRRFRRDVTTDGGERLHTVLVVEDEITIALLDRHGPGGRGPIAC